jgi:PPOX class probable F420-dependent enzyme
LSRVAENHRTATYRNFVGPGDQYDMIGAAQFALLYALGLREGHRLLDIGCGSLRAGRMIIPYLKTGGYVGVDPNPWLIDEALEHELGRDILDVKQPRFDRTGDFELEHLGRFEFVLAHGVATNTGPALVPRLLCAVKATLAPNGLSAVTFIHPGTGDSEAVEVALDDRDAPDWRYPGCYSYDRSEVAAAIATAGLHGRPIGWFHPRHQWWLLTHTAEAGPSAEFLSALTGATLAGCDAVPMVTLTDLAQEEFVSLTTYRRSGVPVPVPVWIAPALDDSGALLITTTERSGKVKRLRQDPRVELRACDRGGAVAEDTPAVSAQANIVDDPDEVRRLREEIRAKYGSRMKITAADQGSADPAEPARVILRITASDVA